MNIHNVGKHVPYYIISITQVYVYLQDLKRHIKLSCLRLGDFVLAFLCFVSSNAHIIKLSKIFLIKKKEKFLDIGVHCN